MESSPAKRRANWPRWLGGIGLLLVVGAFFATGSQRYFSWDFLRAHFEQFRALANSRLPLAIAVFFLIYVAVTALSLPMAAGLSVLAGALFGRWLGSGVVLLAATSGATLAFLSSRFLVRDFVERRFGRRLEVLQRGVERDGAYYLLTLRLVPIVPFFLVNLGLGLTRMKVRTFAIISLIGMAPGTFLYVNAGTAIGQLATPADVLSPTMLLSLALLGLLPVMLRLILRRLGLIHAEPERQNP